MATDSYGELAFAILIWDYYNREGTRGQQIDSERRLRELATQLRDCGYRVGKS